SVGTNWQSLKVNFTEAPSDGLQPYLAGKPLPAWTSGSLWRRSALEKILPFPQGLWGFNDAYCARHIIFFGRICAIHESLGGYLLHTSNDYGHENIRFNKPRLERAMRESQVMVDAFKRRCQQFGVVQSPERELVQRFSQAEVCMALDLLDGKFK